MRPKLLLVLFGSILGIEQGKLELELVREHIARVPKSLYKERLTVTVIFGRPSFGKDPAKTHTDQHCTGGYRGLM